jgi:excisionase family DNA binding protein
MMHSIQPLPPDKLQTASEALHTLDRHPQGQLSLQLSDASGQAEIRIPPELFTLLKEALDQLVSGNGVQLLPLQTELTTQQAAELLQLSRPHLVRLLEQGKLPYHRVGSHHRVKLVDVLAFREARSVRRAGALNALAQESQDLGLE